ncbi:MAG TPA: helix-turn-helix domain-containing protein [Acidimicrobiales bacterium]|nr:helix-turn-helix domain-containing protein [Acidimicrobiales bacterium]
MVAAAERLWAEHGIDGVSLREINRAAGQRNTNALQYHFGDREALLAAVLDKHRRDVEGNRNALLDQYELRGDDDLRTLATALVLPLIAKLSDDEGCYYLQILSEIVSHPKQYADVLGDVGSINRWRKLVEPLLPADAVRPLHRRFAAVRFAHIEIANRARERRSRDDRLFTSQLIDLVTAVLAAPISPETAALIRR